MRKLLALLAISSAALLSGCAGFAFSPAGAPQGAIYTGTQSTVDISSNDLGAKRGEACAMSILGVVTIGDASVTTAARAGGITKLSHTDVDFFNVLGIYSKYCTHAVGN